MTCCHKHVKVYHMEWKSLQSSNYMLLPRRNIVYDSKGLIINYWNMRDEIPIALYYFRIA